MARGKKKGRKKKGRGDSEYTKRSKARNRRRAQVAQATGQRAFSVRGSADVGKGGKGRGSGGGGSRMTGGSTGGGGTDLLLYGGLALGAFLLLSKK